jgi:glycosyltransferase involved in cell wall biosynthesis
MRTKVLVRGPALTRSGYGEHARFVLRSLREAEDKFDIFLFPTNWGETSWVFEDTEERRWLDFLISKTVQYQGQGGSYDVSLQVTIPNEWDRVAPVNIGITAGIETTKVAPVWLEKSNLMDKVITISEFSKSGFTNTFYDGINKQTNEKVKLVCGTPIDVVHYPVKKYEKTDVNLRLDTDFNFLTVAQWGPRKNVENTIRWFVEEFIDQEVGLVVKTFAKGGSILDRTYAHRRINLFLSKYDNRKCKVYLLHGDMTEEEMHSLYTHPKIKAMVTLSHGEGFGLPMYEAAYSGLPLIAPAWSGYVDFMYKPVSGKKKTKAHFAKVEYDISPIQEEARWEGVLQADSMWCFAQQGSYKMKLREVYKDYGRFKKQAKELQKWIVKEFAAEKQYEKMLESISSVIEAKFDTPEVVSFE